MGFPKYGFTKSGAPGSGGKMAGIQTATKTVPSPDPAPQPKGVGTKLKFNGKGSQTAVPSTN